MRTTLTPLGEQLERLKINTGLLCYHYDGAPEAGSVRSCNRIIKVWLFRHQFIVEDAVRQHMIRAHALTHNMSREQAAEYLLTHFTAIPRDQVSLTVESEAGDA